MRCDVTDRAERAAQKESDHQRWADDGGFIPDVPEVPAVARTPWVAVAVAAGIGFALSWLSRRR